MPIVISKEWDTILGNYLLSLEFKKLMKFVDKEYESKIIYPEYKNIFRALELVNPQDIKVVILGQDPYHEKGQANGLVFSVPSGVVLPPSLKNIYKELKKDSQNGDLSSWAQQGVLLLNSVLTGVDGRAESHKNCGWEEFTNFVIKTISDKNDGVVFMLWGNYAKTKESLIDDSRHLILTAAHPSPLSAYRGFFGSNHFVLANNYLKKYHKLPINWWD